MPRRYILPPAPPRSRRVKPRGRDAAYAGGGPGPIPRAVPPAVDRSRPARPARVVIAVTRAVVGAVWTLQGLGIIAGSAMSGTLFWAVAGIAVIVGAGLVLAAELRRRGGTGAGPGGAGPGSGSGSGG